MAKKTYSGQVSVTAVSRKGESGDAMDVKSTPLTVRMRDNISVLQGIGLGLRQSMIELGDKHEPEHGGVMTGAGCGSDAIILEWKGRHAVVYGRDLIRAWVMTFAPEDAVRIPASEEPT